MNTSGASLPGGQLQPLPYQYNTIDTSVPPAYDNRSKSVDPFRRKATKHHGLPLAASPYQNKDNNKLISALSQPKQNEIFGSYQQIKTANDKLIKSQLKNMESLSQFHSSNSDIRKISSGGGQIPHSERKLNSNDLVLNNI